MDVVADTGAVRCGVVVPVDVGHLSRDETLEDHRKEVVRAGVAQVVIARANNIEISQRGVAQRRWVGRGGAGLVAKQPLADQLGFAVRGLRMRRLLFADQVGGWVCRRPRR